MLTDVCVCVCVCTCVYVCLSVFAPLHHGVSMRIVAHTTWWCGCILAPSFLLFSCRSGTWATGWGPCGPCTRVATPSSCSRSSLHWEWPTTSTDLLHKLPTYIPQTCDNIVCLLQLLQPHPFTYFITFTRHV